MSGFLAKLRRGIEPRPNPGTAGGVEVFSNNQFESGMSRNVVIVGNGIAGVTAARFIRKCDSEVRITIVSAESRYHFSRTALMYVYMGHLTEGDLKPYEDGFWPKNRIELRQDYATRVDGTRRLLHLAGGDVLAWDKLVLATGSRANRPGCSRRRRPHRH